MAAPFLLAAAVAAAAVSPQSVPGTPLRAQYRSIGQAIDSGRLEQAQTMIAALVGIGVKGRSVDSLLADLAFARGDNDEALARYAALLGATPGDPAMCERAAIAALRLTRVEAAVPLVDCATSSAAASWRAWNARGILADFRRDWPAADKAYAEALAKAGDNGAVINNLGYSLLLRGEWGKAQVYFARAHQLDPGNERIANNLELTRAALDHELPRRLPGESDRDWAARLNDAGVAARMLGEGDRAVAAFTQALEASGAYYRRAANNLDSARHQ